MTSALIGYTGYVGSTLLKQSSFDELYNSKNISDINGKRFGTIICAGAPGQKWLANKNPEYDLKCINNLIDNLKHVECKKFVLISTVDVFKEPINVDEETTVDLNDLAPYGLNRYYLEKFVKDNFENSVIVRLPGLVGPGLRKNVIFDFQHNNNLDAIDSCSVFQFYPMVNLFDDIQTSINANLSLVHLTTEPTSVAHIAESGFGIDFSQRLTTKSVKYDIRTIHAREFGTDGRYQYTKRELDIALRAYVQSEPSTSNAPE